jgi:branched-chain amino acid aminotransferase
MPEKVFLNDRLVDADQASISISDSGFLYGAGLFETMRSHNGVVFRLHDHLDRLLSSARTLSIVHPYEKQYLSDAVYQVLRANEMGDARLRLTLTNGPISQPQEQRQPTLLISAAPFTAYPAEYYKAGVMVILCPFRNNTTDPTGQHQTTSFFARLLALNLAHQRRAAEALWFTQDNRLADACLSSVFLVKDSVLSVPLMETPALADVARRVIAQLARQQSIGLAEKDLYISDVLDADEIFLTNVTMEVLPVTSVEKRAIGSGSVGPVTLKLRDAFAKTVEQECRNEG